MKKGFILLLLPLLLITSASAAGLSGLLNGAGELPDPADILGVNPILYQEDVSEGGMLYTAYTFPMPKNLNGFLSDYGAAAQKAGYAVSQSTFMDMDAWQISSGSRSAYLVPDFRGSLLFLVHTGLVYRPTPTPRPTPVPTPTPTPRPASESGGSSSSSSSSYTPSYSGGHVEYVEVKQDCFACTNGRCDLCNGSGWYRMYGERVPCTMYCTTCNGLGYWYTTQPVWVP